MLHNSKNSDIFQLCFFVVFVASIKTAATCHIYTSTFEFRLPFTITGLFLMTPLRLFTVWNAIKRNIKNQLAMQVLHRMKLFFLTFFETVSVVGTTRSLGFMLGRLNSCGFFTR